MSTTLSEVIERAGFDLSTKDDANWLLSRRNEIEELLEQAEDTVDE